MNVNPTEAEQGDRDYLARALPVPHERDLPAGRHVVLREFLMQEVTAPEVTAPEVTEPVAPQRVVKAGKLKRRLVLAGALAGAIAVGVALAPSFLGDTSPAHAIEASAESVKVTLIAKNGKFDIAKFERDMAAAGLPTRVVEMDKCGFTHDDMIRQLSSRAAPAPAPAPKAGTTQRAALIINTPYGGNPTFEVDRDLVTPGKTLVVYVTAPGEGFAFAGGDSVTLPPGWKPCARLGG